VLCRRFRARGRLLRRRLRCGACETSCHPFRIAVPHPGTPAAARYSPAPLDRCEPRRRRTAVRDAEEVEVHLGNAYRSSGSRHAASSQAPSPSRAEPIPTTRRSARMTVRCCGRHASTKKGMTIVAFPDIVAVEEESHEPRAGARRGTPARRPRPRKGLRTR
jgi:hypothetical protein